MKTAIVTGASGDIGMACSKRLLDEGYKVVACYFKNEEAINSLVAYGNEENVLPVRADISNSHEVQKTVDEALNKFGTIDVLVNCAAISIHGIIQDVTEDELNRIIDINIKGTFNMCARVIDKMVKNHRGSIINISSMWGEVGASCEVAYSMTKSAVIGLTKALAKEVGPSGIRVNCVSPGLIDTKMNSCYTREDLDAISEETPLMRIGKPKDVAEAVLYLADDRSSFVTGQILGINGGYVI